MGKPVVTHSHLDRQRRPRGDCPACDLAWERQDLYLANRSVITRTIQQLERLGERPAAAPPGKFCRAIFDGPQGADRAVTHTCSLPLGHHGRRHLCPLCDQEWTS